MPDVTNTGQTADGASKLSAEERKVEIEEIVLPPKELMGDWDEGSETEPNEKPEKPRPARETAELDYIDGKPGVSIELAHPFRLPNPDPMDIPFREVREIFMQPLTATQTGQVVDRNDNPDVYDFYAAMAQLPAQVIRGLRGEDADRVTEAGYRFLPRFMKAAGSR